jgi:hypothetical protein
MSCLDVSTWPIRAQGLPWMTCSLQCGEGGTSVPQKSMMTSPLSIAAPRTARRWVSLAPRWPLTYISLLEGAPRTRPMGQVVEPDPSLLRRGDLHASDVIDDVSLVGHRATDYEPLGFLTTVLATGLSLLEGVPCARPLVRAVETSCCCLPTRWRPLFVTPFLIGPASLWTPRWRTGKQPNVCRRPLVARRLPRHSSSTPFFYHYDYAHLSAASVAGGAVATWRRDL